MRRRTLDELKIKDIPYSNFDCYTVCEYKGIKIYVGRNYNGYWYVDENKMVHGTNYKSLLNLKSDVKSELKELTEKEGGK